MTETTRQFTLPLGPWQVPCKVHEPDSGAVRRCILGVHGICGHKDSPVLTSLAEELGFFGAAMVCFDFPAHGENPMSDRELTVRSCTDTLMAAAQWMAREYPDGEKCLFATGFGAFITALALEDLTACLGPIRLVFQTPDFHMGDTLLRMTGLTQEAFHEQGRVLIAFSGCRQFELPYSFYEEVKNAAAYQDYGERMLLIHGECDEMISREDLVRFCQINENARMVTIPGADHQFRGPNQWDMVVDLTRDWFDFQQVLLCDWE